MGIQDDLDTRNIDGIQLDEDIFNIGEKLSTLMNSLTLGAKDLRNMGIDVPALDKAQALDDTRVTELQRDNRELKYSLLERQELDRAAAPYIADAKSRLSRFIGQSVEENHKETIDERIQKYGLAQVEAEVTQEQLQWKSKAEEILSEAEALEEEILQEVTPLLQNKLDTAMSRIEAREEEAQLALSKLDEEDDLQVQDPTSDRVRESEEDALADEAEIEEDELQVIPRSRRDDVLEVLRHCDEARTRIGRFGEADSGSLKSKVLQLSVLTSRDTGTVASWINL